jgi:hypothetical protein
MIAVFTLTCHTPCRALLKFPGEAWCSESVGVGLRANYIEVHRENVILQWEGDPSVLIEMHWDVLRKNWL